MLREREREGEGEREKKKKKMKVSSNCRHLSPKLIGERGSNVHLVICKVISILFWFRKASSEENNGFIEWHVEDEKLTAILLWN